MPHLFRFLHFRILQCAIALFLFSSMLLGAEKAEVLPLAAGTEWATDLHIRRSGEPGPVLMIVGGVHGNETAGIRAATKIVEYPILRGTLLVLPKANRKAIQTRTRVEQNGGSDLNRDFPLVAGKEGREASTNKILVEEILRVIREYKVEWIVDLHESKNYSLAKEKSAVGHSVIYTPSKCESAKELAQKIIDTINKGIDVPEQKWILRRPPVLGSLTRSGATLCDAHTMIVETCQKDNLEQRVAYHLSAVDTALIHLQMKKATPKEGLVVP